MPGLFGFYLDNDKDLASTLVEKMAQSMCHHKRLVVNKYLDHQESLALGLVSPDVVKSENQLVVDKERQIGLVLDGDLYNSKKLCHLLDGMSFSVSDNATIFLHLWQKYTFSILDKLDGQFALAIGDVKAKRIYLITDRFGLKPIFYTLTPKGLVFANEIKAIIAEPTVSRKIDYAAMADIFTYGYPMSEKTLFSEIKLVPAGTCLIYNHLTKQITLSPYWSLLELFSRHHSSKNTYEEVCFYFREAVEKMVEGDKIGLSLSAGLDSRAILAVVAEKKKHIKTYTLGLPGCADQRGAKLLAKLAKTQHKFLPIETNYLKSFLENAEKMVYLSDGLYLPYEFTEMRALDYLKQGEVSVLLRGHGGEIAKASLAWPLRVNQELIKMRQKEDILAYISNHASFVSTGIKKFFRIKSIPVKILWHQIFTPNFYNKLKQLPIESLKKDCEEAIRVLNPGDVALYLFIKRYIGRYAVASLQLFRNYVKIRLPFMDFSFLKALLKLPIHQRLSGEVQRKIVYKSCPAMIKVPDSNTGASLDARPWKIFFVEKIHLVFRLLGVKGHRHYQEFQEWLRKEYRQLVERVLFDKVTLERGYYNPKTLRMLVEQHKSGRYNYGYFLSTILGLELWHRQFVD